MNKKLQVEFWRVCLRALNASLLNGKIDYDNYVVKKKELFNLMKRREL